MAASLLLLLTALLLLLRGGAQASASLAACPRLVPRAGGHAPGAHHHCAAGAAAAAAIRGGRRSAPILEEARARRLHSPQLRERAACSPAAARSCAFRLVVAAACLVVAVACLRVCIMVAAARAQCDRVREHGRLLLLGSVCTAGAGCVRPKKPNKPATARPYPSHVPVQWHIPDQQGVALRERHIMVGRQAREAAEGCSPTMAVSCWCWCWWRSCTAHTPGAPGGCCGCGMYGVDIVVVLLSQARSKRALICPTRSGGATDHHLCAAARCASSQCGDN